MRIRLSVFLVVATVCTFGLVLPFLYIYLNQVVARSHESLFVDDARRLARLLAQQFEAGRILDDRRLAENLLDTAILNGDGLYAELRGPGVDLRSALGDPRVTFPQHEDSAFGEGGDHIYFTREHVVHEGRGYELLLGFDERNTLDKIEAARRRMVWALAAYLALSTGAGLAIGYQLTRPLRQLQRRARLVAGDPDSRSLAVATPIEEVAELSEDLQRMREELVVAGRRLRQRERLEAIGTLAGGVAHEFNNALVPIILLTEAVLKEPQLPPAARTRLQTVLSAGRQAREVVRQVSAFSRELEDAESALVALPEVVRETVRVLQPLIDPQVRLTLELDEQCPPVMADRTRVQQLLMNLCTNAQQALAGRAGHIEVSVRRAPRAGAAGEDEVELAVRDDGVGMSEETMARAFEPFFTTRDVGEGTGLGLSVVHGIARAFGARVLVQSEPGSGSLFRVLFPVPPAAAST